MTYDECIRALSRHSREAVVLATVAHVAEASLENCDDDAVMACVWALDAARRWALGETDEEECRAASEAASSAASVASSAYASAAYAASYAVSAAASDAWSVAAASSRQVLVDSLGEPGQWGPVHRLVRDGIEVVVAGDYAWVCDDGCLGYRRVVGLAEGDVGVLLDAAREAA